VTVFSIDLFCITGSFCIYQNVKHKQECIFTDHVVQCFLNICGSGTPSKSKQEVADPFRRNVAKNVRNCVLVIVVVIEM